MSLMDDLLASLDVAVRTFSLCKIQNGWALALEADPLPVIHYVLKGSGVARFESGPAVPFQPHDFLLIPTGRAHQMAGEGDTLQVVGAAENCAVLADAIAEYRAGIDPDAVIVCGKIEAIYAGSLGFFDRLDYPVSVRLGRADPLRQAFEAMLAELAAPTIGTRALTDALLKQCLVLLVRRLARGESEPAWLVGLIDPRLAAVVTAILEHPARDYNLRSLAEQAGMSRSGFAVRFAAAFGTTPMDYVKRVRLRYAAQLLRNTNLPVGVVATTVGYASRTHFSRAFRAAHGIDPQSFRAGRE